jgi:signal transduction histidine kinase
MDDFADDIAAVSRIDAIPKILEVVCRTTGMGFAAVARVTEDRWIACAVRDEIAFGLLPGGELEVATTICSEIRESGQAVLIDHVAEDDAWREHHTPLQYGFQSYVSTPIRHRGEFFGTLCAIDPRPARVNTPQTAGMFELFADLIGRHLAIQDDLARSKAALLGERETAELREQFIAVLGHDLRNPLAAIDGGARLIRKTPLNAKAVSILDLMEKSVGRMAGLIDNVLDLARGRLGGGIEVSRSQDAGLADALNQVVAELRTAQLHRRIDVVIDIPDTVACDSRRIAQLFSNLLANALSHGDEEHPVLVQAEARAGEFTLSVANHGTPIPQAIQARLFQPFARASSGAHQEGLGLGLYIAGEIARAHQGTIEVSSTAEETRFTFHMPLG